MERKIIRDIIFLKQKSKPAAASDTSTGDDLYDTLTANRERCVGLAANMIGVNKRIIIVNQQEITIEGRPRRWQRKKLKKPLI